MIKCPECGHENEDATVICEICGKLLIKPTIATKKYDDTDYQKGVPRWGVVRFKDAMALVVDVLDTKHSFIFDAQEIDTITIGRKQPSEDASTFLDLTSVGGIEKGVSRHHARIERTAGKLHIVDHESANGTYLNGQRLVPNQPRILRDGDELRLGHLTVRITFRIAEQN